MQKEYEDIEVLIKKFSLKGYGVGVLPNGGVVEVAHSVPGDKVRIAWKKKRRSPQKGRLLEVVTPSHYRVAPACPHVGICGGCSWQQIDYRTQLQEKEQRVREAFEHRYPVDLIIPCDNPFGYRNKMEFSFAQNQGGCRYLGLMIAQAEPYVFNLAECVLGPPWFAEIVKTVAKWWTGTQLPAYNPPKDTGVLRYLTLRQGSGIQDRMAILNVACGFDRVQFQQELECFVASLEQAAPGIALFLRVHHTKKGTPTHFAEHHLSGPDHIVETLSVEGKKFTFAISPSSFFQPNTRQAEKLYAVALGMLTEPVSVIYDLYAGTGTLGMLASQRAQHVIGIELNPDAVRDARKNMERNYIANYVMHEGDVGQVITRLQQEGTYQSPDAVLIDPPRAGVEAKAMQQLKILSPRYIIYISCNPATQAMNVKELVQFGYSVKRIQPVDQFPHTYHIENITFLER